jgi:class 3 adenylate cyclase
MAICPSCGEENPDRARFCLACAAPLTAPAPQQAERKVVSVIFVDLVGFTAGADAADPEDVHATLQPYHARVRDEIERLGGVVEKYVGDAVMAVFGAPVAHEDDAERAVRAGLKVLDATRELGLEARAAVNTGEALVALGARAELGEALVAGDVVNTAARLQSSAETGTLVVGELTYRTTRNQIDYEPLEAVSVKGKAEPVTLWSARGPRSRFGIDVEIGGATPLVGRDSELSLLKETYTRVRRDDSVQLVTLVGEAGVGKTRLLRELGQWLDDEPDIVY